jgi:hypothetical protein
LKFKNQYFSKANELFLSKINDFINTETVGVKEILVITFFA